MYFDLDEGEDIERIGEKDLYKLSIYLVHVVEPDEQASRNAADAAKSQIDDLFVERCKNPGERIGIHLEGCYVYSTREVTLDVADRLRRWNTDHMSLRQKPHGPMTNS